MGCKGSRVRSSDADESKKDDPNDKKTERSGDDAAATVKTSESSASGSSQTSHRSKLSLPETRASSLSTRRKERMTLSVRSAERAGRGDMQLVPVQPRYHEPIHAGDDYSLPSESTAPSTPQLFRIEPTRRAQQGEGTWEWWYEEVERLRITNDNSSRARLQDVPNRLRRQYETSKGQVELDLGWCYMERSAPYVIGRLLASPFLAEIRWVTSLRLDGNYFTDDGFGNMLAVMGAANETRIVLPLLKNLYLNNMNLDYCSIHGVFFYLFPLDRSRMRRELQLPTIAGEPVGLPEEAYMPFNDAPHAPLFPALEVLSLCDNPSIGNRGLAQILRCFISPHYESRILPVLDLSRCGIDEVGVNHIREYLNQLPKEEMRGEHVVIPRRIVLFGNRHSSGGKADDDDDGYRKITSSALQTDVVCVL